MKKILIIGGSGGLSSVVAKKAISGGAAVWAVTRGNRPLPVGVTALTADRNDTEAFSKAILSSGYEWDAVIDCICMTAEHAKQDLEVLSKVTKRLVVVSTDSVYDPHFKKTPQNEDGVFVCEEGLTSEVSYGCNKRRMEEVFLEAISKGDCQINITLFRPGHIYGPGFLLGCFPENSRQKALPDIIRAKKPVRLVGMGTYLIHPIHVNDLARVLVECIDNEKTFNEVFCIGGPEAVENRLYYEYIAQALNVPLILEEIPLQGYLEAHPEYSGHLCHRIYDLSKLASTGIRLPDTRLKDGLFQVVKNL